MYDLGDRATLTFTIPANATVVLTVTKPDQSTTTPSPSNIGTGLYTADVDLDQAGRWTYRWVATGAVTASQTDILNVASSTSTALVSLAEVKDHLNITTTTNDEELRRTISAATTFFEKHIGPIVRRTITETVASGDRLFLSAPVISLTSLTSAYGYSATYTVGNWTIDDRTLVANYGTSTYAWPVTVTYVGGWTETPADLHEAVLNYVKWRWEKQRGSTPLPVPGGDFETFTPADVPYEIMNTIRLYTPAVVA